jgi:DNA-binding NarL/FixJ family response regulator
MRVLVADAHQEVRWALRAVIQEEPGLTLVGEVSDAEQLLSEVRAQRPELILLDWELPGQHGEELLTTLCAHNCGFQVVVLSARPEARQAALAAGANAFVSKADTPQQLLGTVRKLARLP